MKIIKNFSEDRKLIKVTVLHDGGRSWTLQWQGGVKVFQGDIDQFAKFLMSIHAKDDKEDPHSFRSLKYREIADEITNGMDTTIWVWEKDLKSLK